MRFRPPNSLGNGGSSPKRLDQSRGPQPIDVSFESRFTFPPKIPCRSLRCDSRESSALPTPERFWKSSKAESPAAETSASGCSGCQGPTRPRYVPYEATSIGKRLSVGCYTKRFGEPLDPELTLEQIRGREGYRVRNICRQSADRVALKWEGRRYDPGDWHAADPLNRRVIGCQCMPARASSRRYCDRGLFSSHRLHPHWQGVVVRLQHR